MTQDYRELDLKLSEVPINEYTSSELLRLCLRPHDQYDTCSTVSDDDDDPENDQDVVVSSDD